MFSRIRYAAEVLSHSAPKVHPREQPDIVFKEEERSEVTKVSLAIGNFIEVLLISGVVSLCAAPLVRILLAGKTNASVLTLTGFTASLLSMLGWHLFEKVNTHLRFTLRIGEKLAPYFGHKMVRAVRILRS